MHKDGLETGMVLEGMVVGNSTALSLDFTTVLIIDGLPLLKPRGKKPVGEQPARELNLDLPNRKCVSYR